MTDGTPPMNIDFENSTVLVTGAARGSAAGSLTRSPPGEPGSLQRT